MCDIFRSCGRQFERRDLRVLKIHPQGSNQSRVIFDGMEGRFRSAPGSGFMIKKAFVLDGVADFKTGAACERDPGGARPAVKIQEKVESLPSDRPDEGDEFAAALFGGHDENAIDIGMAFDQTAVGFLDEIRHRGLRELPFEKNDGGCRQDDITQTAKTDQKNGAGVQAGNNLRDALSLFSF